MPSMLVKDIQLFFKSMRKLLSFNFFFFEFFEYMVVKKIKIIVKYLTKKLDKFIKTTKDS